VSEEKPKVLLIHVKGRRNVFARAAEPSHKSLNKGDAFVLVDPATRRISSSFPFSFFYSTFFYSTFFLLSSLLSSFFFLLSAFCFLLYAFFFMLSSFCFLLSAFFFLLLYFNKVRYLNGVDLWQTKWRLLG
jgi:hypothetical protein